MHIKDTKANNTNNSKYNKSRHEYQYKTWYGGAGMIILDPSSNMLVVKGTRTDIWSFPKGHPEQEDGDNPLQTAIRETAEETGLVYGQDYSLYSQKVIRTQFGRLYYVAKIHPNSADKIIVNAQHSSGVTWIIPNTELSVNTDVKYILKYVPL